MSEQMNQGMTQLRARIDALGSSIDELRIEASRLESSASSRSALVLLERSAIQKSTKSTKDRADRGPDYMPLHQDTGSELAPEEPAGLVLKDPKASIADADHEADRPQAKVLEFPMPTDHASGGPPEPSRAFFVAGDVDRAGSDGLSPLTNVDAEVEAAFDKFFSAEVEPEPAQRWLLSE